MSKIELTEQQTEKLRRVWLVEETHRKALLAVANELVAMGLVRPASDDPMQREWEDVKARVLPSSAKKWYLPSSPLKKAPAISSPL